MIPISPLQRKKTYAYTNTVYFLHIIYKIQIYITEHDISTFYIYIYIYVYIYIYIHILSP